MTTTHTQMGCAAACGNSMGNSKAEVAGVLEPTKVQTRAGSGCRAGGGRGGSWRVARRTDGNGAMAQEVAEEGAAAAAAAAAATAAADVRSTAASNLHINEVVAGIVSNALQVVEQAAAVAAAAAATAAAAAGVGGGGAMGGAAARSTGSHCGGWATPRSSEGSVFERRWPMACPCADSSVRLAKGAATPMRTRLRKLRDCLAWSFGGQV
jgi:hypothetical protein